MKLLTNISKLCQHVSRNSRCTSTLLFPIRLNSLKCSHLPRTPASISSYTPVSCFSHGPTSPNIKEDNIVVNGNNINDQLSETDTELDCLYRKIHLEVKGHDPSVINSYEKFVRMAAEGLDVKIGRVFTPPKVITRYTLLKSVHIYKKHRVQYENRTHFRVIEFVHLTGSTADTILEYIQRNLPEGMAMKVTKHRIESLPEHVDAATTEK
ncbi:28S ribosomal protein S10, mitochondrial [Octopus bimaculoides]|uniref:28S ribosomal protein S10, mitochondrial n=1 Tax=Octopus bimaculoides TaxID=37653 RepID=UPI00071D9063|nr:28S ribosomal protein S10, mitochondrial [Octopus bimaculoides]|eukprot:XP_014775202.1 PREDICTED: 28S ribosomal protein S10, mitochondrial-like [Octopus bimaculoides]